MSKKYSIESLIGKKGHPKVKFEKKALPYASDPRYKKILGMNLDDDSFYKEMERVGLVADHEELQS